MGQSAKKRLVKIYSKNKGNRLKRQKIIMQNLIILKKLKEERKSQKVNV